jgi:hypothetical protein
MSKQFKFEASSSSDEECAEVIKSASAGCEESGSDTNEITKMSTGSHRIEFYQV